MFPAHQLQLEQLACQRGDRVLFTDLSLQFQSGDFVQIEGHNGIGKTSLLRILAGLALLYLGHHSGVKPELTAWENLKFYQQISQSQQGTDILWDVLETVGLLGREDLPAAQLSAGQQKRIALARLWISEAPLWILDEPFTAIDKKGVEVLTALFENHAKKGGMVILTSHQEVPSSLLKKINLADYKYNP